MMKISVVIPTYKPQQYLWQCLDSLITQTLEKCDFEIILVLNGCCEPWKSRIDRYISTNMEGMNVRVVQINAPGVSNARNKGLDVIQGEYIAFVDDDDYLSPDYLSELYSLSNEDTIALSYELAFNDGENLFYPFYITREYDKYCTKGIIPFYKPRRMFNGPVYKLIHKDVIGNRRFDVNFKNGEDCLFMYLISDRFKKVVFTSKKAVYYRRYRQNSATTKKRGLIERARNEYMFIRELFRIYKSNPYSYNFSFFCAQIPSAIRGIFFD